MTEPATRSAISAVVQAAADARAPQAEQLTLLPPSKFGADTQRHRVMRGLVAQDRRGPGRPEGARNLATREALRFVREVLGDPLIERARWAMHTPATLARELGCTELEAFDRLDKIRADLAQFFYPRLAPVDGEGNAVAPFFALQIGGARAPGAVDAPPWAYLDEQAQQNQSVSESSADVSHADVSHAERK